MIGEFYGNFFTLVNIISAADPGVRRLARAQALRRARRAARAAGRRARRLRRDGVRAGAVRSSARAKLAENSVDYSLQNTTRNALYLPTSREAKYKAKQANDTFFVRFGDVVSAGMVFAGTTWLGFAPRQFALVNVVLIVRVARSGDRDRPAIREAGGNRLTVVGWAAADHGRTLKPAAATVPRVTSIGGSGMFLVGFSRRLGLEAHERRTMLLMAALVATLICAYTVAKVLRDALFLSEFRGLELPYAYIGGGPRLGGVRVAGERHPAPVHERGGLSGRPVPRDRLQRHGRRGLPARTPSHRGRSSTSGPAVRRCCCCRTSGCSRSMYGTRSVRGACSRSWVDSDWWAGCWEARSPRGRCRSCIAPA